MFEIETKELKISEELGRKIDIICRFACVKPYILTIDNNDYLIFEEFNHVFINEYENKILFKDLKEYIKNIEKNNKILDLGSQVDYWKDKFMNMVNHFKERIIGFFEKEKQNKYNSVATDLYINYRMDKTTYNQMFDKNQKDKEDDFEL